MSWQTLLRHIRYLWLRNPRNLTDHQTDRLSELLGPWGQALSAEDWGAPTAGCSSSKGSTRGEDRRAEWLRIESPDLDESCPL